MSFGRQEMGQASAELQRSCQMNRGPNNRSTPPTISRRTKKTGLLAGASASAMAVEGDLIARSLSCAAIIGRTTRNRNWISTPPARVKIIEFLTSGFEILYDSRDSPAPVKTLQRLFDTFAERIGLGFATDTCKLALDFRDASEQFRDNKGPTAGKTMY